MLQQNKHLLISSLAAALAIFSAGLSPAFAKDPLEAAHDLASSGQADPNGFTLMVVSICMLFVFALSLIIATSVHAFKKKPAPRRSTVARNEATPAGL